MDREAGPGCEGGGEGEEVSGVLRGWLRWWWCRYGGERWLGMGEMGGWGHVILVVRIREGVG